MLKCVNSTSNLNRPWNPICEDPAVVSASINQYSRIRFIISSNILNPEKATNSITSYLDSSIFNVQQDKMYTTANLYLNSQTLITDESVLPLSNKNSVTLNQFKSGETVQQNAVGSFSNLCDIYFERSQYTTIAQKSYLKLDTVISYIGGFCQIFFLVSAFIVSKYNSVIMYNELANRLYDFDYERNSSKDTCKQQVMKSKNIKINPLFLREKSLERKETKDYYNNNNSNNNNNNKINDLSQSIKDVQKLTQEVSQCKQPQNSQNKSGLQLLKKFKSIPLIQTSAMYETPIKKADELKGGQFGDYNLTLPKKKEETNICLTENANQSISDSPQKNMRRLISPSIINSLDLKSKSVITNCSPYKLNEYSGIQQNTKTNQFQENKLSEQLKKGQTEEEYLQQINQKQQLQLPQQSENLQETATIASPEKKRREKSIIHQLGGDPNQFLDQELKTLIERDRSLWIPFQYILNQLTCGKFFNTIEVKLFDKAYNYVNEDLDVFTILDRQKEVEKIKKLLFNEDQEVLFNFFPKPVIKVEEDQVILNKKILQSEDQPKYYTISERDSYSKKLNISLKQLGIVLKAIRKFKRGRNTKMSNYQRIFEHYQKLVQQCDQSSQGKMNRKLIDLLGDEMKNIFEITNFMQSKSQEQKEEEMIGQQEQKEHFLNKMELNQFTVETPQHIIAERCEISHANLDLQNTLCQVENNSTIHFENSHLQNKMNTQLDLENQVIQFSEEAEEQLEEEQQRESRKKQ